MVGKKANGRKETSVGPWGERFGLGVEEWVDLRHVKMKREGNMVRVNNSSQDKVTDTQSLSICFTIPLCG